MPSNYSVNGLQFTPSGGLIAKPGQPIGPYTAPGANPSGQSNDATKNAQQAVMGLQNSNGAYTPPQGGGPGSNYSVDTEGKTNYTVTPNLYPQQQAGEQENIKLQGQQASSLAAQQSAAEAALQAQKFQQGQEGFNTKLQAISGMNSSVPPVSYPGGGGNEEAARSAAFARAKEQAGQNALAGLRTVQENVADRGLMDSSYEANLTGNVISGASGQVNDFTREQLIQDLNRAAQISDTTYQGNITQRGQDLQRQQALLALLNAGGLY